MGDIIITNVYTNGMESNGMVPFEFDIKLLFINHTTFRNSSMSTNPTEENPRFYLHYRKHKYIPETIEPALLYDIQNYIPIYSRFFDVNDVNYNGIQLNQKYYLQNIIAHPAQILDETATTSPERDRPRSLNHLETIIADDNGNTNNTPIFVKYSPLLDPIRYLSGKYLAHQEKTRSLPKYNSTLDTCEDKMLNTNNSSYVDGFFSYLTSQALHTHGIIHGVDYYGSYLCKQREFSTNVFDDIDYLVGCSFFNNYENDLFTIDYSQFGEDDDDFDTTTGDGGGGGGGGGINLHSGKLMKLRNKMKSLIGNTGPGSYIESRDELKNKILICEEVDTIVSDDTMNTTATGAATELPSAIEVNLSELEIQNVADVVTDVATDVATDVLSLHPKKETRRL